MRFHVGAQDGVDTGVVSALAAEPSGAGRHQAHGDDFFRCGQDDFGGLPELRICGAGLGSDGHVRCTRRRERIWAGVLRPRGLQSVAPARFVLRFFVVVVPLPTSGSLIRSVTMSPRAEPVIVPPLTHDPLAETFCAE